MPPCTPPDLFGLLRSSDVGVSRFKRVGPNAMRGRGIGTARGRATIMRGLLPAFLHIDCSANVAGQLMVPLRP